MDLTRIRRGEIPWAFEGYWEALAFRGDLLKRPMDDWPRTSSGVPHLVDPTLVMDSFDVEHQYWRWLAERYDQETAAAHWARTATIARWGPAHESTLIRHGLLRQGPRCQQGALVLFQALATLPFARRLADGTRTFSMRAVLARTEWLIAMEQQGDRRS